MSSARRDVRFRGAAGAELTASVWSDGGDTAGSLSAMPVLLLHGLSQQRLFWGPVVSRLRTTPIASLDQRGHGESDTAVDADYSLAACAADVVGCLDALGWSRAVLAGHSWGGSVALRAAALHPDRVAAAALIDGGLWSPAGLGPREEVRARLTPPRLGVRPEQLWSMIQSGELGRGWSSEIQSALEPTFIVDSDGLLHSRLGLQRHMAVLDGLLDADPESDLGATARAGTSLWAVVCDPRGNVVPAAHDDNADPWNDLKERTLRSVAEYPHLLVHRWAGAIHDVPLQWPDLVAGFIDTVAADAAAKGGESDRVR